MNVFKINDDDDADDEKMRTVILYITTILYCSSMITFNKMSTGFFDYYYSISKLYFSKLYHSYFDRKLKMAHKKVQQMLMAVQHLVQDSVVPRFNIRRATVRI